MQSLKKFLSCFFLISTLHLHGQNAPLFTLLPSTKTGITFQNTIVETEELNVLSYEYLYNGGGVAAGDINNDGLIDLYFTANMRPDKLFLNKGGLKFEDITKQAKVKNKDGWKTGVSMADVNGDGWLDIYVCYSGNGNKEARRNKLYINNGDLTFTERAKEFGLDDHSYSTHAAFFDYDRDNDLDMYLLNHNIKDYKELELKSLKSEYDSLAGDKLYRNDNNFFSDVSEEAHISGNPISFGLGVSISDINSDGWPDIYVSNDYQENDYLYINLQNGSFQEQSEKALGHMSLFSMGNDVADVNNDGLPDIFSLDMLPEDNRRQKLLKDQENYELYKTSVANGFQHQLMRNMLHLNNGDGSFSEIGQLAGISNTDWSWSALFADFDNDGQKDLYITNGYLRDYTNKDFLKYWGRYLVEKATTMETAYLMDIVKEMPSTKTPNCIFKNNGNLTFKNSVNEWGCNQAVISNGAAYADLDNDGDLELIVNNVNENAFIYKNNCRESATGNYLQIRLVQKGHNHLAFGARVCLYTEGTLQMAEQNPARGYQSTVTTDLHFGLGSRLEVDSIIVNWPDGTQQRMYNVTSNQLLTISHDDHKRKHSEVTRPITIFTEDTLLLHYSHKDLDNNDFKRQPTMPFMYSYTTPVLADADLNNDGLDDIFIASASGQPSKILIQQRTGKFDERISSRFYDDRFYNSADAAFFDADGDGDEDLYVASGGYHDYKPGNVLLNDRLYFNDGNGNFHQRIFMETNSSAKSCVRPADFDNDGDLDLFVGGRVVPGKFPEIPQSYLLENDGKGNFKDVSQTFGDVLQYSGMVSDAGWVDLNHDKQPDLIVCGEWRPLSVFINTGNSFEDQTAFYFGQNISGFWTTLKLDDLDDDGDVDIIAGNLGINSQIKVSAEEPAELIYDDFDANGSIDPIFCYFIMGRSYPDTSRDLLLDQIYPMRKKFVNYASYANATIHDIFDQAALKKAKHLFANSAETSLFFNVDGKFEMASLPMQTQFSPVTRIEVLDVNDDLLKDIVLLGNFSHSRLKYGKSDANFGTVLINSPSGFSYAPQLMSGLHVTGDVKDSIVIDAFEAKFLISGVSNGNLKVFRLNRAKQ
jgi:enediyne biosynthesis protein E4